MNGLPDFLEPLNLFVRPFPCAAVEEAIRRRDESIPHLLRAIKWADENPDKANDAEPPHMLYLFALFLLAEFRETRAYPLVVRLCKNPLIDDLLGDTIGGDLHCILASVCGGDTQLIESLIEDSLVDEFVRGAAIASLGVLLHNGMKSRDATSAYLGALLGSRLERSPSFAWDSTVALCTDFGFTEHLEAIRAAYRDGLPDELFDRLADVEREIANPESGRFESTRYRLIDDTVSEMEDWYCFSEDAARDDADDAGSVDDFPEFEKSSIKPREPWQAPPPPKPTVRESPKIGRNDPCPCGSGKKYKKCCGLAAG